MAEKDDDIDAILNEGAGESDESADSANPGALDLDWPMLARPRQTVVVYMGAETLPIIAARLIEHGLPSATPVALIENGTTSQERRVVGTLATIEQQARRAKLEGPTLCMIGEVIGLALARDSEFRFVSRICL